MILVLALPDLAGEAAAQSIEDAFVFADEGETCALAKALPLLPGPERFVWRAGECCRTNMLSVFESAACDSPFAVAHFDDVAWRQAVIKTLFIGAPMWRVRGLDRRLDHGAHTGRGHGLVVVGGAAEAVDVGIEEAHRGH